MYVFRFFKNLKPQVKSPNFSFFVCLFFTFVTKLIQMMFEYVLQFVVFTWPSLVVVILCPAFVS